MDFGSEFVYSYSDSEEEEISAEAIETSVDSVPEAATQAPSAPARGTMLQPGQSRRATHRSSSLRVSFPLLPVPTRPTSSSEAVGSKESQGSQGSQGSRSSTTGEKWRRADTNVVILKFDRLTDPSNMHTGDSIVCVGCQAMLSHISKINKDGNTMIWTCEFCETKNVVEIVPEEIPTMADVTYMLEPALVAAAVDGGASGRTELQESIVVFCIDYSGSMGSAVARNGNNNITRLDGVKSAVCHQFERLADSSPGCRVAVVAFNHSVEVIGDGKDMRQHRIPSDIFDNKMRLLEVASNLSLPSKISESRKTLMQSVLREQSNGSTALGPGLLVSLGIARQMARSKVIVCTDGQANLGLGNLGNTDAAYPFYTEVAEIAKESGVSVSVLTIYGTDCRLVELGRVAELTGGQVNIVDPLTATEEFGNILTDRIIATHVTARFFVHRDLYVRGEPDRPSHALRDIGNVIQGTEISFEYGVRPKKKPKRDDGCKGAKKDDGGDDKRDEPDDDSVAIVAHTTTAAADDNRQKHCEAPAEPSTLPVVQEPVNLPATQESTAPPVISELVKVSDAQETVALPVVQEPACVSVVQESANLKMAQEPDSQAMAQESVNLPMVQEPDNQAVPDNLPVVEDPAKIPAVQKSTEALADQEPANLPLPIVQEPADVPVTQKPSSVARDEPLIPERSALLPFQVQIRYTDTKGAKAVRVLTETKPVTKDRKVAESRMNIPILGTHAIQYAADKAIQGQYMESRLTDCSYTNLFQRNAMSSEHYKKGWDMYELASKRVKGSVINAQRTEARSNNSTVMDAEKMLQKKGSYEVRKQRRQMASDKSAEVYYKDRKLSSVQFAQAADKLQLKPPFLMSPSSSLWRETSSSAEPKPTLAMPPAEVHDQSEATD